MYGVGTKRKILFEQQWRILSEYITAVAWSSDGLLAASSAAGKWLYGKIVIWLVYYLRM